MRSPGSYDFLNHLLSAGIDRRWRKRAIRSLALTGRERVLDLCTGTADLAIAARSSAAGRRARRRRRLRRRDAPRRPQKLRQRRLERRLTLVRGDATRIPLADGSVDAVTIAFGIRNVENTGGGVRRDAPRARAGRRVWRFSSSRSRRRRSCAGPISGTSTTSCPAIGRLVSRHNAAYGYLPASVGAFASPGRVRENSATTADLPTFTPAR